MSHVRSLSLETTGLAADEVRKNAQDLPILPLKYTRSCLGVCTVMRMGMETAREGTVGPMRLRNKTSAGNGSWSSTEFRRLLIIVSACVLFAALMIPLVGVEAASSLPVDDELGRRSLAAAPLNPTFVEFRAQRGGHAFLRLGEDRALGEIPAPSSIAAATGAVMAEAVEQATPGPSYDLRTLGRLTSVKNQGSFGTCWAFASCGSLESGLMPGENLDFSEDNMALKSGFGPFAEGYYDHGGNLWMSTAYVARWGGPVYESDDSYGDSYTPSGLGPRKHVQEINWIPARSSATDNEAIKNAIMEYGAAYVSMYWNSSTSYYKASTSSYYYPGYSTGTNHAVLIVGWNDNYSASNFSTTPAGNGAFIVRNSWGTSWGDDGFFYVSYYDYDFGRVGPMAVFNDAEATSNYEGVYQYDPLGDVGELGYGSTTGWFANVFTAQADSSLTAVGFYTVTPGTSYQVYTGSSLGTKTLRTSGTLAYMGYHTVTLPSQVEITNGQQFVVAVKVTSPDASYPIAVEYPVSGYSTSASADPGQSYVSSNGTSWSDLTTAWNSEANVCLKAYVTSAGATEYTLSTSVVGSGSIGRSPDQTTYAPGAEVTLTATPASGWLFSGWSGGATGSTNPLAVTMNASKTITATFVESAAATRYEQTNSLLTYAGTWSTLTSSGYSGGSLKRCKTPGASVTVVFEGTGLTWIATTGAAYGKARLTLDGGTSFLVDLYSPALRYKQGVYSTVPLSPGTHTLKIECTGLKNPSASYTYVNIDAFDVVGRLISTTSPTTTTSSTTTSSTTTTTTVPPTTSSTTSSTTTSSTTSSSDHEFVHDLHHCSGRHHHPLRADQLPPHLRGNLEHPDQFWLLGKESETMQDHGSLGHRRLRGHRTDLDRDHRRCLRQGPLDFGWGDLLPCRPLQPGPALQAGGL